MQTVGPNWFRSRNHQSLFFDHHIGSVMAFFARLEKDDHFTFKF